MIEKGRSDVLFQSSIINHPLWILRRRVSQYLGGGDEMGIRTTPVVAPTTRAGTAVCPY
jgi:hypothetical protein